MTKTEAYRIMGLSLNQPVTLDLLKSRYRILTRTYHPDNPRTGSEEMMAKINLAFDALRTFSFDPEDEGSAANEARRGTGFVKDFNPDFTPFEYGSRDNSYYENNRRYEQQHYERYNRNEAAGNVREVQEEEAEYVPIKPRKKKKKKSVGYFLLKFIAIIIKIIILIAIIGFCGVAALCVYKFGLTKLGILLAVSSVIMAGLFVLVFKFFGDLTS